VGDVSLNNGEFNHNWRCRSCRRLIGVTNGKQLEFRNAQGDNLLVRLPVIVVCRNPECNTINELRDSKQNNVGATEEGLLQP